MNGWYSNRRHAMTAASPHLCTNFELARQVLFGTVCASGSRPAEVVVLRLVVIIGMSLPSILIGCAGPSPPPNREQYKQAIRDLYDTVDRYCKQTPQPEDCR